MWCNRTPFLSHHWEKMPHKHQLQSDGPDQLSSSCSPAGKQCFFVEKPYKKLIRKNNLLNSKKVAFKTILQRLHRCWKVTSSVGWEDDLGERQWLELRSTFSVCFKWDAWKPPGHFDAGETELGCSPLFHWLEANRCSNNICGARW